MRSCPRCEADLPEAEFYRDPSRKDGLSYDCRGCHRRTQAAYRKANQDRRTKVCGAWAARNPERVARYRAASLARNATQLRANKTLQRAVRTGKIVKPSHCSRCQNPTERWRLHGHHEDYSQPLVVTWLCHRCHMHLHAECT